MTHYTLRDFDFALPPDRIAQYPTPERSASRLLDGRGPTPVDRIFRELPDLLDPRDLLVFNDTAVMRARLFGEKASGGKVELLIERVLPPLPGEPEHQVVAHMKVSKKPAPGAVLQMVGGFRATLLGRWPNAQGALFRFALSGPPHELMAAHGHVPLPPYITHADRPEDAERYQTVFARHPGAVAAPTAALHFDEGVLAALDARGIARTSVTLHVGAGTFQPVRTENIAEHTMHSEWYSISQETVALINEAQQAGGDVIAVGTTSLRALESASASGQLVAGSDDTQILITPGYRFQTVTRLITNFHLPKSTLMMLVSAFAGYDRIRQAYARAIEQRYRFFSYGDAMLLDREQSR